MRDPVWAESLANAPQETIAAVTAALEDLVLATPDLCCPPIDALPEGRARRHLEALIRLWSGLDAALPDGLSPVRHVLNLPKDSFLDSLPVVEGSLDPNAPVIMRALFDRLKDEFGAISSNASANEADSGTRLHALQTCLLEPETDEGNGDSSLKVFGLRDAVACAEFAAARARALIESGVLPRDIAVLSAGDPRHLAQAFAAQGVPLSGLPVDLPQRDIVGETALHLLLAKRPPTPAMVLASLALSPLMPWASETGRALAETVMKGDFKGKLLEAVPEQKLLWEDLQATASSLPQLRFLADRICAQLAEGESVRARMPLPPGDGGLDWESILRDLQIQAPTVAEAARSLEGVSLWSASENPWRPCGHLIITDFTEGCYPIRPKANPLFLDSEIEAIRRCTGLELQDRAVGLSRSLTLLQEHLRATSKSVTFLVPWRDLAGARLAPSAGLSLIAQVVSGLEVAADLIMDLSRTSPEDWPVAHHLPANVNEPMQLPEVLDFGDRSLLALRLDEDGRISLQTPSRLETLVVSPLAWLLQEIGAEQSAWVAETLDIKIRGTIAHDVFEHVFPPDAPLPEPADLPGAVEEMFEQAISRYARFLRGTAWEMERAGLCREIKDAALRWRGHLEELGAKIVGNELWLRGEAYGIRLRGKADSILQMSDGALLVVDHKKSGSSGRRKRMRAGWDLQVGLYRDMLARPEPGDGYEMDRLIGKTVGIAYHLMNDGGLLTSGIAVRPGGPAQNMGDGVNGKVSEHLRIRLEQVGAGKVVLNTTGDEAAFRKEGGFTPYALTDGSPIVRAFLRPAKETEA
jgi:ATP-dependent helicase/nuclease subunit B